MSRYVLGLEAAADLDEIWDYIAQDSLDAADRWIERLFETFEGLAQTPRMGHSRKDLTAYPVLFWPVGAYLVIYRLRQPYIEIVAVTHGGRDVPALLGCRI